MAEPTPIRRIIQKFAMQVDCAPCKQALVHNAMDLGGKYDEVRKAYFAFVQALRELDEYDADAGLVLRKLGEE